MSLTPESLAYILSLEQAQQNLYRFGGPIFIFIGTVSGVFSLIVFTQKILLKSPCSIYFNACNVANLILIYGSFLPTTLEIGYHLTPTIHHRTLCRLRLFVTFLFNCLCPFYLLLALVDRVLVTSPNARTRQRSTHRLALISIIIGTVCWIIGLSHVLVFSEIIIVSIGTPVCYVTLGWYSKAISYGSLIKETLIPLLMAFFGLWSIRNIRNIRRITTATNSTSGINNHTPSSSISSRARDRQMILMLLVDITIYIFFSLSMAISLMYEQITLTRLKSLEVFQVETFVKSVAIFASHIPFGVNFYANLLVSKTFRKEVRELLSWKRFLTFCRKCL